MRICGMWILDNIFFGLNISIPYNIQIFFFFLLLYHYIGTNNESECSAEALDETLVYVNQYLYIY